MQCSREMGVFLSRLRKAFIINDLGSAAAAHKILIIKAFLDRRYDENDFKKIVVETAAGRCHMSSDFSCWEGRSGDSDVNRFKSTDEIGYTESSSHNILILWKERHSV